MPLTACARGGNQVPIELLRSEQTERNFNTEASHQACEITIEGFNIINLVAVTTCTEGLAWFSECIEVWKRCLGSSRIRLSLRA